MAIYRKARGAADALAVSLGFALLSTAHCGSSATGVVAKPKRLIVAPADTTVHLGTSYPLRVTVLDSLGESIANTPLVFGSTDQSIATVSPRGLVTAKMAGGTTIAIIGDSLLAEVSVTVLDSNVVARIPFANHPYGVATSSGGVVYVAPILGPAVRRLNMTTFKVTDSIAVSGNLAQVAFVGAGATALVDKTSSGFVGIIDVATQAQVDSIPIPGSPYPVRVSADGSTAYVTSNVGWVYKIDIASRTRTDSAVAPNPSLQIALGPGDSLLYVSAESLGTVTEIRTATMAVVRTFTTGGTPQGLAVSSDGAELYVADESGPVRIWSLASGIQIDALSNGGGNFGLALSPNGTRLFVSATGAIFLIDRASRAIIHRIAVSGTPRNIAVDPVTSYAVVPNEAGWIDIVK